MSRSYYKLIEWIDSSIGFSCEDSGQFYSPEEAMKVFSARNKPGIYLLSYVVGNNLIHQNVEIIKTAQSYQML